LDVRIPVDTVCYDPAMTTDAPALPLLPPRSEMLLAVHEHDSSFDGIFWFGVRTTGVFCRPGCRPPRAPKPENLEFFASIADCQSAGYRPCKLCRPTDRRGGTPAEIALLIQDLEVHPDLRISPATLRERGLTSERVRRWFHEHEGMTFTAWWRARRLSHAYRALQQGARVDDVALGSGFESHSGFREAFGQTFGHPPGQTTASGPSPLTVTLVESPIGPLLAGATDEGVALLEFADRGLPAARLEALRETFQVPILPGRHPHLNTLTTELDAYFAGRRQSFSIPVIPQGTPFQRRVWTELGRIPFGTTASYLDLARNVGRPTASRAVARANGQNPIVILIPCHRVIGKDGTLTGYGGGLWRKRLLLELERTGRWPGH
jgi:AraC family transcriptional regulator of adaptative response/methylated-DNA-[protein]-cysteine methyltransferase